MYTLNERAQNSVYIEVRGFQLHFTYIGKNDTIIFFNSNFQPKIIQVLVWWKHWKLAVRVLKFTNDTLSAALADWKTAVQMRALRHSWKNVKNNFFYSRQPNDSRRAFLDFNTSFFSLFLVFEARFRLEIEPIVSRGDVELRNKHQKAAPMWAARQCFTWADFEGVC